MLLTETVYCSRLYGILNEWFTEGVTFDPHDFIVEQVALHNTRSLTGKDTDHRGAIKVNGGDENVSVGRGNDVVINTHLCMLLSFYSWLLPCVPKNLLYSKIVLNFLKELQNRYTKSLVNTNSFYTNFNNTHFQKVPIPHLICTMKQKFLH